MTDNHIDGSPLKKELGLLSVFSIAAGAMISSGLFVLPGIAYARAGPGVILAYALASFLMIPVMLSKAELSTAMPKSGGSYFFIERSLGPLVGTVAGFTSWLSIALKATFALVGIGTLGTLLFPQLGEWALKGTALVAGVIFVALNAVSTKESGRVQYLLVLGLLAIIAAYVVRGIPRVTETRYIPFIPAGWQSVFAVVGMVAVSYGGLTKVVSISEEVRNPTRNLPLGMFIAFGVVSILYVVAIFTTVGLVEGQELAGSLVPISLGAEAAMGPVGTVMVNIGALLAFATTANSGILSASRAPLAMSRDGLLPGFFSMTSKRFGTPLASIWFTALFMMGLIVFLSVEDLIKTASTMMLLLFGLVNLSVIIMRESGIQNYRPTFRAPLYPWLQIIATVIYGFLVFEMGRMPLLLTAGFILAAVCWYFGYVHLRIERQSALVYLVKRILSRHIGRTGLDEELVKILLERDEVAFDRFDHLISDCPILDIQESINARQLFRRLAETLSSRVGLTPDSLYNLFLERERESSTVIQPGLAIPHVVVPGERIFDIVLVRCKGGVVFSELQAPVSTAFVLVGSADERNYHLRALMTIAHIIQEPGFEQRWMAAATPQQLRDIVLLSRRTREKHGHGKTGVRGTVINTLIKK
jgi:amino acid transporter/mannitol/fructose-specific phosphotransferase system IIA component (Ntr-type)